MFFLRRIVILIVGVRLGLSLCGAQESDSLIINEYYEVIKIFDRENLKEDTLIIEKNNSLKKGDTVLLIQSKGARWNNSWETPAFSGTEFSGRFEFQIVHKRINDTIILRRPLASSGKNLGYKPGSALQLIKVPSYKYFKPSKILSASGFNGAKGGVLAFFADTFELNGSINVTGKGFRGANPSMDTSKAICWSKDSARLTPGNFTKFGFDSAGLKGESMVEFSDFILRGRAPVGTGGGGGNGHYSGGGGGGSFGRGGVGGMEGTPCDFPKKNITGGQGGVNLSETDYFKFYTQNPGNINLGKLDTLPYALMGGGGGASVNAVNVKASKGGAGGGLVFIIANVVKSPDGKIIANGENVSVASAAGGGGGGGGGAIFFDVNNLFGKPTLSVRGGTGGSTVGEFNNLPIDTAGPGGGGGGGYILFHGDTLNAILVSSQGLMGRTPRGGTKSASAGGPGISLSNLTIPLRGFLFNIMPPDQEICEGETPKLFKASEPKGAAKYSFRYIWRKSTDLKTWTNVSNDMRYQSGPLVDTSFFQRIVHSYMYVNNKDSLMDSDTSNILVINVLPAIKNNFIHSDTFEVCEKKPMPYILGGLPTGGNGTYTFLWKDSVNGIWKEASGDNQKLNFLPGIGDSVKLRRIVKSGVCTSYSNLFTVDVLPQISGNDQQYDVYVEMGRYSPPLKSDTLFGGKAYYSFEWLKSNDKQNWVLSDGSFDSIALKLPKLNDTTYFKRIVKSGLNNTCISTSPVITVYMLDSVYSNQIGQDMLVCQNSAPLTDFMGSQVFGGDKNYKYVWEVSYDSISWDTSGITSNLSFNPGILKENCFFRRIAISGPRDACKDTSNSIFITIRPYIRDFELLNSDTIICYNQNAGRLLGKEPQGGDGPYVFQWFVSSDLTNWSLASGVYDTCFYQTPSLLDTTYFFRKIESGVCSQNSDTLKVIVLPPISSNTLDSVDHSCYAALPDSVKVWSANGGDGKYRYKWIESLNNINWLSAKGVNNSIGYKPDTSFQQSFLRRIVISGAYDCCIDTSNSLRIHVNALPEAFLIEKDDSLCLGNDYKISINIDKGKAGYRLSYSDGKNEYAADNLMSGKSTLVIKPSSVGEFGYNILNVVDANNCKAKIKTGLIKLNVFEVPNAKVEADTAACGLIAPLKALPAIGKGKWSARVPAKFLSGDSVSSTLVQIDSLYYGQRIFTWTLNNGGCIDSAQQRVVFYQPPPDPLVGEDFSGPFLFKTNLKAYLPKLGQGKWTTPDESIIIEDPSDPVSKVENLKFGKNHFLWYVENGLCVAASDTFTIEVQDIKVPGGFSPNNDDKNQFFEIQGLGQAPNSQLIVLNRWGKEVYKSNDYKNDWDGTVNGNPLPSDTYFYLLNTIGRTYKGYVVIKR